MSRPSLAQLYREGYHGRAWYESMSEPLAQWADRMGTHPEVAAAALAVGSPRVSVRHSIGIAATLLGRGRLRVMRSVQAAWYHYVATGIIRGPKTHAFWRALQGDPRSVVVDVWLQRALGLTEKGMTPRQYQAACERIKRCARYVGDTPAATQAAIWAGIRTRYGRSHVDLAGLLEDS